VISKLTSDNIQGMLNALDHPVAAKINEIIDMVNAGGILQDLQSVLDTGSVAAITTPFDIGFGMLDVFDLVAGHGTVHGAFDISSTNTYGPAYPPRDPTAALGPSSFAAGFLNEVTGYAAAAFAGTSKPQAHMPSLRARTVRHLGMLAALSEISARRLTLTPRPGASTARHRTIRRWRWGGSVELLRRRQQR